jgi:hypothetical protein
VGKEGEDDTNRGRRGGEGAKEKEGGRRIALSVRVEDRIGDAGKRWGWGREGEGGEEEGRREERKGKERGGEE